jgi:hypothetical protein
MSSGKWLSLGLLHGAGEGHPVRLLTTPPTPPITIDTNRPTTAHFSAPFKSLFIAALTPLVAVRC